MLSTDARQRLAVVLVGARNPQNIGAAARAMQDFGFTDLRVVNAFGAPFEAAQLEATSAVGVSAEVLRSARRFDNLAEAIADCTHVVGTTAIGERELRHVVVPLAEVAPSIRTVLGAGRRTAAQPPGETDPSPADRATASSRVALLFGSEKTGLTNEQLSFCSQLLTIPLFAPEGRHLSMNLGQAVAVCLYELAREGLEGSRALPVLENVPATTADRERLTALLQETMRLCGYSRRFPANARTEIVRQLAAKLADTHDEAATWMGFLKLTSRAASSVTGDEETPSSEMGKAR